MGDNDYLLYTYTGDWNSNILNYTQNFPYSLILHPNTQRLMHNGIVYGDGKISKNGPHFIKGLNLTSDTSGAWIGSISGINEYTEGLSIIFVPSCVGDTTQTTLEINGLGARNCYFTNDTPLTQQYSIGTPILLTYIGTASTGYWKRADMDTTQTPVKVADSTYQNYYINLTSVTNGLTDIYTIGSKLRYVYDTETLYSPNFNGNFTGNLTGNAQTASALNPGRYIWKKFFDGSADISGHIEDTGHIYRLHDSNNYNIGESSYKYYQVFGNFFRGRADGVKSLTYSNQTSKICLLGHDPDIVNVDVDSSDSSKNTGTVYSTRNVYITTDFLLHSPYISCGSNSAFDSNYTFVNYGASKFQNEVLLSTNTANLIVLLAKVGIGTSTPTQKLHVYGGNAIFEGSGAGIVTANSFVKSDGTSTQVLLANGTVKEWSDSNTLGAIVARNASGNVYANRYFSNISEETLNSIGSVYVTNSANDTAIRKVSFETFVSAVSGNNIIEIAKNLKVTIAWMDTGITTDSTTFPGGNGSYIVQIDATSVTNSADGSPTIYSGIMTIYDSTNVADESEEIILHRAGEGTTKRLYLRTISTSSGAYKLQIAASNGFANTYNLKFRFKKII